MNKLERFAGWYVFVFYKCLAFMAVGHWIGLYMISIGWGWWLEI